MRQRPDLFSGGTRLLVLYDGECPFCRRSCAWLEARDRHDVLNSAPFQQPGVLESLDIAYEEALSQIQVVSRSGERRAGADGVFWAVGALPGFRWLPWLLSIPGVRPLARWAYRQVAQRRPRQKCAGDRCHIV